MADSGTISRIGGILKNTFGPRVEEQQNKMAVSRKRYGKADSYFRAPGDHFEFPARVAGARGAVAPAASDDALPTPKYQNEQKFSVYDRGYTGQINFYEKDLKNAESNWQSFIGHLEDSMTNIVQDTEKLINIDFVAGDGSGILSIIGTGTSSATQTLKVGTAFGQYGSRYLMIGDWVDVYDSTLTTSRTSGAGVYVNSITPSVSGADATVVFSASLSSTTGDIVVRGGGRVNKSYTGLYAMTDDAAVTFQGIARGTYPITKGNHIAAGSVSLTESLLQQMSSATEVSCGEDFDEYLASQAQWDQYLSLSYAQKRFMDTKVDKGFATVKFAEKDFVKDVDIPPSMVYGIKRDTVKFGEVAKLGFMDEEGQIMKWNPGFAGYRAVPREYGNFCYTRPNANARLDGLTYPLNSTYAR